jgi:hypothetical protein
MSKIALSGNASGTGTFTLASPNSSTDRTLDLPDAAGTIQVSGNPISGTTGTFTGLVDISAAGAGQIAFPATQNASANANTLDDYEEGTWTPSDGSGAGLTFTSVNAFYTKVGRMVTLNASFTFPSTANAADVSIGGIPFAYSFSGAENCMTIFDNAGLGANQVYFAGSACDFRAAGTNTIRTNAQFSLKRVHLMVSYSTSA